MTANEFIEIPCIEIEQPIGTFYTCAMDYHDLINISVVDPRRLDPDLDDYLGIQRILSNKRVEELQQYVDSVDATFPTGIILAIMSEDSQDTDEDTKNIVYSSNNRTLRIRNKSGIAKVIDGQHRIKGLEGYTKNKTFQLNVTIFVDMEIEDQAMVFATINLAQTKVTKSLAYDLYEYTRARSPQKTAHNVARLLNSKGGSPFLNRIKILGTANPEYRKIQTITQATFVEAIIRFISGTSKRALEDKNLLKENKRPARASVEESVDLVFRNMFLEKKDAEIAKVVWNYFAAVDERWNKSWNNFETTGNILPRTNGFRALIRLFPTVYNKLGGAGSIPSQKDFFKIFAKIPLPDGEFTSDQFLPGSSGEGTLYNQLLDGVNS